MIFKFTLEGILILLGLWAVALFIFWLLFKFALRGEAKNG